jgi:hypothetical protein
MGSEMSLQIREETRARTTKCHCNFACLEDEECLKCIVERSFGEIGCLIKSGPDESCAYRLPFADKWFCRCPTRVEIYEKYGL